MNFVENNQDEPVFRYNKQIYETNHIEEIKIDLTRIPSKKVPVARPRAKLEDTVKLVAPKIYEHTRKPKEENNIPERLKRVRGLGHAAKPIIFETPDYSEYNDLERIHLRTILDKKISDVKATIGNPEDYPTLPANTPLKLVAQQLHTIEEIFNKNGELSNVKNILVVSFMTIDILFAKMGIELDNFVDRQYKYINIYEKWLLPYYSAGIFTVFSEDEEGDSKIVKFVVINIIVTAVLPYIPTAISGIINGFIDQNIDNLGWVNKDPFANEGLASGGTLFKMYKGYKSSMLSGNKDKSTKKRKAYKN
jgi:hypothetical protein